jgi:hypothetical protein
MNMKNQRLLNLLLAVMLLATTAFVFTSCDDDEPPALTLTSLTANDGAIDLNNATSATGIPVGSTIVAEFSTEVDETSTNAITLTRQFDGATYPATVTVNGRTVTIDPNDNFSTGTLFIVNFGTGLKSKGGKMLTEGIERNFTTEGTFAVPGAIAQWTFEDNANDIVGNFDPAANQIVAITYEAGRKAEAGKAATFNGTSSIIEVSNADQLMNPTGSWTISFWAKPVSTGHVDAGGNPKGHFVLGLGAFYGFQFEINSGYTGGQFPLRYAITGDPKTVTEGFGFAADGKDKDNGGWQGWEDRIDLTASGGLPAILKDKWVHVVYSFNKDTKKTTLYFNGQVIQIANFNLWPAGDDKTKVTGTKYGGAAPDVVNELAFGFIQSRAGTMWDAEPWGGYDIATANHFRGQLDDVIIYHKVLTPAEITSMYNSGKP